MAHAEPAIGPAVLRIGPVFLPESELHLSFSRSGGPGGQNVNKLNTRVTLTFDVTASPVLTPDQKQRVLRALPHRISRDGILRISSSTHRTQRGNRAAVIVRFIDLLTRALTPATPRRPTKVPAAARRRRLADKRQRSERKSTRTSRPRANED
ncbi:MAG TPA: alternative ribosome rescue aminoacyl-tRNA hydrolase ArfB [Phycisphaerae bacterium]|jgi:ribosome-associated protein